MTGYTTDEWNRLVAEVAASDAEPCRVEPGSNQCAQHPTMTRFVPGIGNVCLVGACKMTIEQWSQLAMKRVDRRDVAAYLLDRADQYVTESPCWVALANAAHNIMLGDVEAAKANGDLDDDLYMRVDAMRGSLHEVDPTAGVNDE